MSKWGSKTSARVITPERTRLAKLSKNKGARGEIAVRDGLLEWWRPFEPDVKIARAPGSGGWIPGKEFGLAGDLVIASQSFPFSVEVKWQEGWVQENFLAGKRSPVWTWWRQCVRDAEKTNKQPMLWAGKNHEPWLVVISYDFARHVRVLPPDAAFSTHELESRGVKFGILPVAYYAERFLELRPEVFAK